MTGSLRVFIALALATAVSGCLPPPAVVPTVIYEPAVVDIIESVTPIGGEILEFELASGGSYRYDSRSTLNEAVPTPDDLLLAGARDGPPWAFIVSHDGAGGSCYRVRAPAFVRDRRVLFATGLSLPMAPSFDPSSAGEDGIWANDIAGFCISAEGVVVSYN